MFHTVFLGSRAIGGSEAWGYSGMGKIVGQEDKLFPFQISFIRPAATPAAPYTVNTAPSSPEPSPSRTES